MLSAIFLQKAYFIFLPVILICKFVKKVFPDIHNKFFIVQHLIQIFLPAPGLYNKIKKCNPRDFNKKNGFRFCVNKNGIRFLMKVF